MKAFQSIRVRLTLWYAAVLAVLLVLFSSAVYGFVYLRLSEQIARRLDDQYAALAQSIRDEPEVEELEELDRIGLTDAFEVRTDGGLLYRSRRWPASDRATTASTGETTTRHMHTELALYRVRRGTIDSDGQHFAITVAVSEREQRAMLGTLAAIFLAALPIGLCVALVGGWWMAARVLAPIAQLTARAREISAEKLSERLPIANPHDELGRLAAVINEMLGRLDSAFGRLRVFTADASHELRTPLTVLCAVGEAALQDGYNANACREAVGSMLEEADRLVSLLDNLLVLTRADADGAVIRREACDLGALASEVAELMAVLADEKQQQLVVDAPAGIIIWADPMLVRQAVLNVLDNAIKFTPVGGHVEVRVGGTATLGAVTVRDSGPGIAPEHRERIFERFYRADSVRASERGAGLGLPIAQWAVTVHGGRVELETEVGMGSAFRLLFPLYEGDKP